MAQTDDKIRTINLEPIGMGTVTVEEASETAANIYNELANLGKEDEQMDPNEVQQAKQPAFNFNTHKLITYGLYTGGGIAAVYLIGKALE
jgi:hypothetical protein